MFDNRIFYGSSHWSRSFCHGILYEESVVCTCKAMLFHIQTCDLFLSGNTKSDGVFDHLEDDCHRNSYPCDGDGHTNELNTEAVETAACEKSFPFCTCTVGEKSYSQCSESTVEAVYTNSTNWIINFENFVNKLNTKYYDKSGNDSDDSCRGRRYGITACCDGYQSCKGTIEGHGDIWFFVTNPCDQHNGYRCNSSGKVCCYEDLACAYDGIPFHADGRCTVETEPAEPEDKYTKGTYGKVMSGNRSGFTGFGIFSDTGSKDDGANKCCNTTDHMNGTGTCEIMKSHLTDKSAAPDPVTGYRINNETDQKTVDTVGDELGTFCHGTGYDGGRCCAEYSLEDQECPEWNSVRKHCVSVVCLCGDSADLAEETVSCTEHDTETNQPEDRSTDTEVHQVFHNDITCVFCSCESCFDHCESGLHEKDQRCTEEDPDCVN